MFINVVKLSKLYKYIVFKHLLIIVDLEMFFVLNVYTTDKPF